MRKHFREKKPTLYLVLLITVGILLTLIFPNIISDWKLAESYNYTIVIRIFLILNTVFLCCFWISGFKDIMYVIFYYIYRKKFDTIEEDLFKNARPLDHEPKILLLYCTCNDFMPECLYTSMQQEYRNFETYILDDSSDEKYIEMIDDFAKEHPVKVIRRENRVGFKAGNLNNFLGEKYDYDYFVILDSDEIIPPNFMQDSLKVMLSYDDIGIVQARHTGTRNENFFMQLFSRSIKSHWPTYLQTKQYYGFQFFFGHGALISKECYFAAGKFPHLVAEDLCFSLKARLNGYLTMYVNTIECEEQFPVDYYAFKKRHSKWTQGNLEFIEKYAKLVLTSELKWYEKLDLVVFTFNLPLMAIFTFYLLMNIIIFPILKFYPSYNLWILIPTAMVLLAPTFNDIIYFLRFKHFFKFIFYWIFSFLLYGSLFFLSFTTYIKALLGVKARFIVTPKEAKDLNIFDAIKLSKGEIFYATMLSIISLIFTHNLGFVILIIIPAYMSPILFLLHRIKNQKIIVVQEAMLNEDAVELLNESNGALLEIPIAKNDGQKMIIMPESLLSTDESSLKQKIESEPFPNNEFTNDSDVIIVVDNNNVKRKYKILTRHQEEDSVFVTVSRVKRDQKKIKYPLTTTKISYTDIGDFY